MNLLERKRIHCPLQYKKAGPWSDDIKNQIKRDRPSVKSTICQSKITKYFGKFAPFEPIDPIRHNYSKS